MKKEKQNNVEDKVLADDETLSDNQVENNKNATAPKITKIGAMLKEMRQQKGLKLVDVSKKLCIRKCYLEAIEESNYSEIPPFPYGNGFIRSYATYLGLNSENIIELYREETNASKVKNVNTLEPQPEATMPNLYHILISLLAIALVYAGFFFYNQNNEENKTDDTIQRPAVEENINDYAEVVVIEDFNSVGQEKTDNSVVAPENETTDNQIVVSNAEYKESTSDEQTEATNTNSLENNAEVNKLEIPNTGVYIEVLKTTWVEVKDNDKLYLSKVLQPGELYEVPKGEGKILSVGKYDGVNVYINGVLTNVVRPQKKMNIYLDKYINPEL